MRRAINPSGSDTKAGGEQAAQAAFEGLRSAAQSRPRHRRVYRLFGEVFRMVLEGGTASCGVVLAGPFAKADYLLKEHGAGIPLIRAVNDLRVRLGRVDELGEEELGRCCLADLRALCEFVALVHGVRVPAELAAVYAGRESAAPRRARARGDCLRVLVRGWDERFIHGMPADGDGVGEVRVCYTEDGQHNPVDRGYLRKMLYEGASLNVVPPFEEGGVVYGTYIIFEPDCLVNVQTVASCFTEYADSPLVALLGRLRPSASSDAITLGNFAGHLLDRSLRDEAADYGECVRDYYQGNALSFIDIEDAPGFHAEARRQLAHIADVVDHRLPGLHAGFDKGRCMVEPSFFCEMLGLQGRMDCLQLDFKLLLEQKSGKGGWPSDNPRAPRQRREHYMQVLLYMLIIRHNYHALYTANKEQLSAYLLYSKYDEPLIDCHFHPSQAQEAIKLRNGIAALELHLARKGGWDFLSRLRAEDFNEKGASGALWQRYQRPQIEQVLLPVQEASELERRYVLRFLAFVSREHLLAKLGGGGRECSGFASAWHESLEAKQAAGNIHAGLRLVEPQADDGGVITSVTLRYSEDGEHWMSNFRRGDIVVLYPYAPGTTPDLRTTMVFRCTIDEIASATITLRLRAPQGDKRAFEAKQGCLWAFEHDFMESSFSSLYRGLHAFLSAPKARRDLILLQRTPEVDPSATLRGDYGAFNELVLRVKRARELFLIIGPPGTGKTSFGLLNNVREELLSPEACVLILSYTNRAVDEICGKLEAEGIDYIRVGSEANCDEPYRPRLLSRIAGESDKLTQLKERIDRARVVVGTTASISARLPLLALRHYSLCIVDEASQILEPHLIGILAAHTGDRCAVGKLVLIGDHKQLPAVVQQDKQASAVSEPPLQGIGLSNCRDSLFERLLRRYGDDPAVTYQLSRQGRMHNDIAEFPSVHFYDSRLEVARDSQRQALPPMAQGVGDGMERALLTQRVVFIDACPPEGTGGGKVNEAEAGLIARVALLLYKRKGRGQFVPSEAVGIIVPYRNQIAAVRQAIEQLARRDGSIGEEDLACLAALTIDTVERFQGSQRECILYGTTVQTQAQLQFLTDSTFTDHDGTLVDRKLNVALTRAKERLVIVGNARLLEQAPLYHRLIDHVRQAGGYIKMPPVPQVFAQAEQQTLVQKRKMR